MSRDQRGNERQGPPGGESPQATKDDAFVKHLERASSVVRTWPAWKQEILGGTSSQPQVDSRTNSGS